MRYQKIARDIDWPLLITLLRRTYIRGDGGLAVDTGIASVTLTKYSKQGLGSWPNGVKLWNLAIDRLSHHEIDRCVLDGKVRESHLHD